MKRLLVIVILISGCRSSYFMTCNDAHNQKAILYLRNKDTIPGAITVTLETFSHANVVYRPYIQFTREGKQEKEYIPMDDIVGYKRGADFYALKKVDLHMNGAKHLLFVKRLTPDSSKIHLYELHESGKGNDTGESLYSYYFSLPGFGPQEAINTRSSSLLPYFEAKMSMIVADCPVLAAKIRSKKAGYYIPVVSFKLKKHPEVLLKIIDEYNKCN